MLTRMQNQIDEWELRHGVVHHAARARFHKLAAHHTILAGGGKKKCIVCYYGNEDGKSGRRPHRTVRSACVSRNDEDNVLECKKGGRYAKKVLDFTVNDGESCASITHDQIEERMKEEQQRVDDILSRFGFWDPDEKENQ